MQLLNEFFINFWSWWYVEQLLRILRILIDLFNGVSYYLRWDVNTRYLFTPLYKDYSFVGRVVGLAYRLFQILFAAIILAITILTEVLLIIAYLIFPFIPVIKIWQILII